MKINLPRAPIQIQRDALLIETEQLRIVAATKQQEIDHLRTVVTQGSNNLTQKDNVIRSLQSQLSDLNKDSSSNISQINFEKDSAIRSLQTQLAQTNNGAKESLTQKDTIIGSLQLELSKSRDDINESLRQKDGVIRNLQDANIEKERITQDLQHKLTAKDILVQSLNERIETLHTSLNQSQSRNINPIELQLLKEQMIDKKSIIELLKEECKIFKIKSESNRIKAETYKMKAEQLKAKLLEYTLNNISISESNISIAVCEDVSHLQSKNKSGISNPMLNSHLFDQEASSYKLNELIPNDTVESVFLANDHIQFADSQLIGVSEINSFSIVN